MDILTAKKKEKKKAYREANKEKVLARHKAYREANKEKLAALKRAQYAQKKIKEAGYTKEEQDFFDEVARKFLEKM